MPFLILAICIIIVISILTLYFKSNTYKGKKGEKIVARKLGKNIPNKQYVINDLIIKAENNSSSQIDHIVVNEFGIWVIETKNYAGIICGNDSRVYWMQILAGGNVKNEFYSPVKQNASHIYHLSKILGTDLPFHNIVVFTGNVDISRVKVKNVYYAKNIKRVINNCRVTKLTGEEISKLYLKLLNLKEDNSITKRKHKKNAKTTKRRLKCGICPRCGGKLKLRYGQYGEFYGCSNYPGCTFTKNIEF